MAPKNKLYRILDKYLDLKRIEILEKRKEVDSKGRKRKTGDLEKGLRARRKIVAFFKANDRWPTRRSKSVREQRLGCSFENLVSKESTGFDAKFRRIVMAMGRKSNNKSKHNVQGFKQDILAFVKEHGRVPTTHSGATVEGEGTLRGKLDYYTKTKKDMTLLGKVYETDKCHLSGIPSKYRAIINANIDLDKPLARMVK